VQARVGFQRGGSEGFQAGQQFPQPPVVVDPGLVVVALLSAEPPADGPGGDLAGPLPVRAVQPQRVRRSMSEPGSTMPVRAIAASSAAIVAASS
jgi:hypothetical protein